MSTAPPVLQTPPTVVRSVDITGRVDLPLGFARAVVRIEVVSDTELRVVKTGDLAPAVDDVPDDPPSSVDDMWNDPTAIPLKPLSARDAAVLIEMMENPPEPTPALRKAMAEHKARYG